MSVKVHLEGDGLSFDDETSVFNAAQIIGFLKNSEALPPAGSTPGAVQAPMIGTTKPRVSPREVLIESGAKTNPQKIVVLGNYLITVNDQDSFTTEEVKSVFKRAGEPMPKNMSRDVQTAVNLGLIYEEAGNGHYVLTDTALKYVESGFPGHGNRAQRSTKAKKDNNRRAGASSRVALNEELLKKLKETESSLQEYIQDRESAYNRGASNQVAIIATWLLDEIKVDGIAPSDLQAVRRYLGVPAGNPSSQLNNAKNREGYFSHTKNGKFLLSSKGEDFGRIKSRG